MKRREGKAGALDLDLALSGLRALSCHVPVPVVCTLDSNGCKKISAILDV